MGSYRKSRMRIAINQTTRVRGAGISGMRNLLSELLRLDTHNEYVLFVASHNRGRFDDLEARFDNLRLRLSPFASRSLVHRIVWEQCGLPLILRREGFDLLYSPLNVGCFLAPCPQVLYISGIAQFAKPGPALLTKLKMVLLRGVCVQSLRRADAIVFISAAALRATERYFDPRGKTIVTIAPGVDFVPESDEPSSVPAGLQAGRYVLSVSTLYWYKNVETLIQGFAGFVRLTGWPGELVIVGQVPQEERGYHEALMEAARAAGIQERVIFTGRLSSAALDALYRDAFCYATVSRLESFGMTIREAYHRGMACVVSDIPAFREVAGEAALFVDPSSADQVAEALERLFTDPDLREHLRSKARHLAGEFTWRECARRYLDLFERMGASRPVPAVADSHRA